MPALRRRPRAKIRGHAPHLIADDAGDPPESGVGAISHRHFHALKSLLTPQVLLREKETAVEGGARPVAELDALFPWAARDLSEPRECERRARPETEAWSADTRPCAPFDCRRCGRPAGVWRRRDVSSACSCTQEPSYAAGPPAGEGNFCRGRSPVAELDALFPRSARLGAADTGVLRRCAS